MARGNYGPEIRSSIGGKLAKRVNTSPRRPSPEPGPGDTPADVARDKQRGIAEGSPQDESIDARAARNAPQAPPPIRASQPMQQMHDPHSVGAATSIAHAILGRSGGGGY